ncbi:MAG: diaminopimelate epimerase [Dongiaceae bacterium]
MDTSQTIAFARMHGCGNDFVVIDDRDGRLAAIAGPLARAACDRRTGLGGDGLMLIGAAPAGSGLDFSMLYINADGNEGEMCGNGARCIARRAADLGIVGANAAFRTGAGIVRAALSSDRVTLGMTDPVDERPPQRLTVEGSALEVWSIDTGVPHAGVFVDDLAGTDVARLGRALRHHPAFAPRGANANFATPVGPSRLRMRTYERGVEAETLACGTGAVAVALIACRRGLARPPVTIEPTGGGLLEIGFRDAGTGFRSVTLAGPTELIATGILDAAWLAARGLAPAPAARAAE